MKFLSSDWGGLSWTPWFAFADAPAFRQLPDKAGLYRIRARELGELFYIGETGRNVRERLGDLRRNTLSVEMPFNDPHTAAPSLWAWHDAEGYEFECSASPVVFTDHLEEARKRREGLEFYLLWQYRLEFGSSTRCNHGRFHLRYTKSTDRKKNVRGSRQLDHLVDNGVGGESFLPLQERGVPSDDDWMGLIWSRPEPLGKGLHRELSMLPGVYKIFDGQTNDLLYVGETSNLRQRLTDHARKNWQCQTPLFSWVQLPERIPSYQRREIENDLLGGFYAQAHTMPAFQLIGHH
ncbi:GIY-YIG nuclease family protein [Tengunoibacter tsumagoiensis]|uniref:GIY-YIG domain-containing protein n=1 Tax=Tengunoibacter tsumagoiensis TaxID=2014871 RepID=A0A402A060_9CHLR|nr:GIY-YIG nuclease family protein [Tengunoibacter tsumagoiensis]GCE12494.1 hypothetical protein KTT_23530 [Tengunoibacter tsumagoiensis]